MVENRTSVSSKKKRRAGRLLKDVIVCTGCSCPTTRAMRERRSRREVYSLRPALWPALAVNAMVDVGHVVVVVVWRCALPKCITFSTLHSHSDSTSVWDIGYVRLISILFKFFRIIIKPFLDSSGVRYQSRIQVYEATLKQKGQHSRAFLGCF